MTFKNISLPICLILGACATPVEFLRKETAPQRQAVLRYQSTSKEARDNKAREEVQKKARDFCAGDFDITKEYQARQSTGTSSGLGTGFGFGMGGLMVGTASDNTAMYNVIEVACKSP